MNLPPLGQGLPSLKFSNVQMSLHIPAPPYIILPSLHSWFSNYLPPIPSCQLSNFTFPSPFWPTPHSFTPFPHHISLFVPSSLPSFLLLSCTKRPLLFLGPFFSLFPPIHVGQWPITHTNSSTKWRCYGMCLGLGLCYSGVICFVLMYKFPLWPCGCGL